MFGVVVSRSLIFSTFPDKWVVIDSISSFRSSWSFWAILSLTPPNKLVAWDTISCVRNRCSVWAIVIDHWFFHRLSQTNWSLETPFPVLGVAEWSELWHLDHRFFHRLSQTNCLQETPFLLPSLNSKFGFLCFLSLYHIAHLYVHVINFFHHHPFNFLTQELYLGFLI